MTTGTVPWATLGFLGLTGRRQHAMRTSILSPGSICQSVIFGSLTLRKARALSFGVKFNFSKIRMEPVMHDFLAITKNRKKKKSEQSSNNRGKVAR